MQGATLGFVRILYAIRISRVKNAPDDGSAKCDIRVCLHTGLDSAMCNIRVCVHAVPNKISRVKTALDYDSARCDIRACVHAVDGL